MQNVLSYVEQEFITQLQVLDKYWYFVVIGRCQSKIQKGFRPSLSVLYSSDGLKLYQIDLYQKIYRLTKFETKSQYDSYDGWMYIQLRNAIYITGGAKRPTHSIKLFRGKDYELVSQVQKDMIFGRSYHSLCTDGVAIFASGSSWDRGVNKSGSRVEMYDSALDEGW